VKKIFYGRIPLENATSLFRFQKKGITQQLIHNLKYRGQEKIGESLGKWLGDELKTIKTYKDIDIIIPVPLHKSKLKKRGYNQVAKFGEEIAKSLHADFNDTTLIKKRAVKTQVFKKRIARWNSINEVFDITETSLLQNKHILLVDDIITTGATMEACAIQLQKIPNIKLSIASMAIA
jgi:ComF family protein